jgi:hypothetical protein
MGHGFTRLLTSHRRVDADISITDSRIRILSLKSALGADTVVPMLVVNLLTVWLAVLALVAQVRVTVVGSEMAAKIRS